MLLFVELDDTHTPLPVNHKIQASEVLVALSTKLNDLLALVPEPRRVQEASQMFFLTLLALLPPLCVHHPMAPQGGSIRKRGITLGAGIALVACVNADMNVKIA
jgi:hypothetical protein